MKLSDYLRDDLVVVDLEAGGMADTLRHLSAHLGDVGIVDDVEELEAHLVERERAHTTVLGEGVAIPHATLEGVAESVVLVASAREPIPFGPSEVDPVRIFFLLVSPPGRHGEHIKLLARICRLARKDGFVEELREAGSAEEALRTIRKADEALA